MQRHDGVYRSLDLESWEDVTARASFPFEGTPVRMRHGSVLDVPMGMIEKLQVTEVRAQ